MSSVTPRGIQKVSAPTQPSLPQGYITSASIRGHNQRTGQSFDVTSRGPQRISAPTQPALPQGYTTSASIHGHNQRTAQSFDIAATGAAPTTEPIRETVAPPPPYVPPRHFSSMVTSYPPTRHFSPMSMSYAPVATSYVPVMWPPYPPAPPYLRADFGEERARESSQLAQLFWNIVVCVCLVAAVFFAVRWLRRSLARMD